VVRNLHFRRRNPFRADDNAVTLESLDMSISNAAGGSERRFVLTLFVCGASPRTDSAVANLRRLCEDELRGDCSLEVVDVLEKPDLAEAARVLATPTLIKLLPPPIRRIIGDLSDREKLLVGLEIGRLDPRSKLERDSA
jgi:circadian clock protein KaiB